MTENNAAQPGLTDDEILHRWDIYVSDPCAAYPLTDADKIDFARAIESALLSKLRAEGVQAGDEREAFEAAEREINSRVDLSVEWRTEEYANPWVMDRWRTWRRAWKARTALASAPVAGEAQSYPGDDVAARLDNMADDQPPGSQAQSDLYAAATIWRKHIAHRAAPQASEAVRSERLERANNLPEVECPRCELKVISSCGSKGCPTNDGYADLCQPQADKDGGDCAKGAVIDLEAAAKALSECMDYPWAHMPEQGRQQMLEHAQTVINAALSTPSVVKQSLTATQTGEKGESDAG